MDAPNEQEPGFARLMPQWPEGASGLLPMEEWRISLDGEFVVIGAWFNRDGAVIKVKFPANPGR